MPGSDFNSLREYVLGGINSIEATRGQITKEGSNSINSKNMKETNQKIYKIVFNEVVTKEYTYNILAESEEDAKAIIKEMNTYDEPSYNIISRVVTQVK